MALNFLFFRTYLRFHYAVMRDKSRCASNGEMVMCVYRAGVSGLRLLGS